MSESYLRTHPDIEALSDALCTVMAALAVSSSRSIYPTFIGPFWDNWETIHIIPSMLLLPMCNKRRQVRIIVVQYSSTAVRTGSPAPSMDGNARAGWATQKGISWK